MTDPRSTPSIPVAPEHMPTICCRTHALAREARPTPVEPEARISLSRLHELHKTERSKWGPENARGIDLFAAVIADEARRLAVEPDGLPLDVLAEAMLEAGIRVYAGPGGQGWRYPTENDARAILARLASTPSEAKP